MLVSEDIDDEYDIFNDLVDSVRGIDLEYFCCVLISFNIFRNKTLSFKRSVEILSLSMYGE